MRDEAIDPQSPPRTTFSPMRYRVALFAIIGIVAMVAAGASLAAVASGPHHHAKSVQRPASFATSPTTTPTPTTTGPSTTGVTPCSLTRLDGVVLRWTSAAGTQNLQVALNIYRATSCSLEGTPTVTLLGTGDAPLPTSQVEFPDTAFDGQANVQRPVVLSPGQSTSSGWASFMVSFSSPGPYNEPETTCPATSAISVTLSGVSGSVVVPAVLRPAGPAGACGTILVGSLYAGLGQPPGSTT